MGTVSDDLRAAVEQMLPILRGISDANASASSGPRSWSAKQIIGHLIDSASNNHQRFIRAQFSDDLVFPGYEQDAWVQAQAYQAASWGELLEFWAAYNLHLARVISVIPPEIRRRPRHRHNLHQLAWRPVPADVPSTLEYFMCDYVGHLKHHLRQICRLLRVAVPVSVHDTRVA